MFAQHRRTALLAALLTSAMLAPAWSAEGEAAKPETAGAPQVVAMSSTTPPEAGPVIARESLATEASARETVVIGESHPTRGAGSPAPSKRIIGARSSYSGSGHHRYGLMLGIGY
jgi:hypothetical protein